MSESNRDGTADKLARFKALAIRRGDCLDAIAHELGILPFARNPEEWTSAVRDAMGTMTPPTNKETP